MNTDLTFTAKAFLAANGYDGDTIQAFLEFVASLNEGYNQGGSTEAVMMASYLNQWADSHAPLQKKT